MKFELNEWKTQLTDEEIIADIKKTAATLGKDYISISTYKSYGKYSQTAIQVHFGTWKNALTLAGLRTERNSAELKLISDEEYFDDLRRVANLINKKLFHMRNIENMASILLNIFSLVLANGMIS